MMREIATKECLVKFGFSTGPAVSILALVVCGFLLFPFHVAKHLIVVQRRMRIVKET